MTPVELARLFDQPAEAGRRAQAARAAHFGRRVLVRAAPAHPPPTVAALLRGEAPPLVDLPGWSPEHVAEALAGSTGARAQAEKNRADATAPESQVASDRSPARDSATASPAPGAGEPPASATAGQTPAAGDPGWPEPGVLQPGDRLIVQVDHGRLDAYFAYLVGLAAEAPEGLSFAPVCARPGGLLRLHLLAAARIALPGRVRVEARHDLMGIRLAQVALGFGADTLAGPLAAARRLPLAGVPRPDEATPAGLAALIERAGLEPVLWDLSPET